MKKNCQTSLRKLKMDHWGNISKFYYLEMKNDFLLMNSAK